MKLTHLFRFPPIQRDPCQSVKGNIWGGGLPADPKTVCRCFIYFQMLGSWNSFCKILCKRKVRVNGIDGNIQHIPFYLQFVTKSITWEEDNKGTTDSLHTYLYLWKCFSSWGRRIYTIHALSTLDWTSLLVLSPLKELHATLTPLPLLRLLCTMHFSFPLPQSKVLISALSRDSGCISVCSLHLSINFLFHMCMFFSSTSCFSFLLPQSPSLPIVMLESIKKHHQAFV